MQFVIGKNAEGETLVGLVGYVGSEPERRTTDKGTGILNFGMVIDYRKGVDGTGKSVWANVVAFNQVGNKRVEKGDDVFVTGRVQEKTYSDRDGTEQKKKEVVADAIIVSANAPVGFAPAASKYDVPVAEEEDEEDDLPF
jgi:single-strand DNA-binding protein